MNQNVKHSRKIENSNLSQKLAILKTSQEKLDLEIPLASSEEWRLRQEPAIWLEVESRKSQAIVLTKRLQNC